MTEARDRVKGYGREGHEREDASKRTKEGKWRGKGGRELGIRGRKNGK